MNRAEKLFFVITFYASFLGSKVVRLFAFVFFIKQIKQNTIQKNGVRKIIYYTNFPIENAGTQYRVLKWKEIFEQKSELKVDTFLTEKNKQKFEKYWEENRVFFISAKSLLKCFWFSFLSLQYDVVIVRRELLMFNDYGNCFMEKMLLAMHPNVVLDFDDDISASKKEPRPIKSLFGKLLMENGSKFSDTLKLYNRFIVGSNYLKNLIDEKRNNTSADTLVIPTCVDYNLHTAKQYHLADDKIVIGWIGGDYNLHYIDEMIDSLQKIAEQYSIKLLVIAGNGYHPTKKLNFEIENRKWSTATEKDDIKLIDIGLMPLNDSQVARGKCGYKLIQYMGLGVVAIASPITINNEIVDDGINSFLVKNNDWESALLNAISNKNQFEKIGEAAKEKINRGYSFTGNFEKYYSFLTKNAN